MIIYWFILDFAIALLCFLVPYKCFKKAKDFWIFEILIIFMRFFVDFIMGAIASLESQALFGLIWIGFSFRDIVVYVIFGFSQRIET